MKDESDTGKRPVAKDARGRKELPQSHRVHRAEAKSVRGSGIGERKKGENMTVLVRGRGYRFSCNC